MNDHEIRPPAEFRRTRRTGLRLTVILTFVVMVVGAVVGMVMLQGKSSPPGGSAPASQGQPTALGQQIDAFYTLAGLTQPVQVSTQDDNDQVTGVITGVLQSACQNHPAGYAQYALGAMDADSGWYQQASKGAPIDCAPLIKFDPGLRGQGAGSIFRTITVGVLVDDGSHAYIPTPIHAALVTDCVGRSLWLLTDRTEAPQGCLA